MSSFIYITKQAADKYKNQFDSWTRVKSDHSWQLMCVRGP